MSLKACLWGIGAASFLTLASFLAILWFFSPQNADPIILFLLLASLFMGLAGLFALSGFYFRFRRQKETLVESLGVSLREGTLLSVLLVGFLLMKSAGVFYWWLALIFLIVVTAIEAAFLSQER